MHTVSELIERFIAEMGTEAQPGVKPLGDSHLYILRRLQKEPIGAKVAEGLRKQDIIEHCKFRREDVAAPYILGKRIAKGVA